MTASKRLFDLGFALFLCVILALPFLLLLVVLLITEGRPLFYVSERMKTPTQGFSLIKLRTMANVASDAGVTGGDKAARIGPVHRLLRRARLDEVYAQVLQNRPGITGLASLRISAFEEAVLSRCETSAQTDAVYRRRCVPRKAALDLIYQRHQSFCFDLALIGETALRLIRR